ncbi:hypothetical protein [Dactylosporangium sp. CA-092794]|uniref:hypothetical protein n=1 Tax=Dactylosporangium sp. CA-092794 TaxID=3239929 RepID=UPI003D8E59F1
METATSRVRAAVAERAEARRARRRLAREIAAYRTPAERLELDLILGRHTEEQIAEIDAILREQRAAALLDRYNATSLDLT